MFSGHTCLKNFGYMYICTYVMIIMENKKKKTLELKKQFTDLVALKRAFFNVNIPHLIRLSSRVDYCFVLLQ